MDYDGFRQMVLGANLFPLKSGATASIVAYDKNIARTNFNATDAYRLIAHKNDSEKGYDEDCVKNTLNLTSSDQIIAPKSPCELERYLAKKCQDSLQRYIYLRVISFEHYCQIFEKQEVETDLLLLLCKTFDEQVVDNVAFNNAEEQEFVCQYLTMLATITTSFDFVLELMGEAEQKVISDLISKLTEVDN